MCDMSLHCLGRADKRQIVSVSAEDVQFLNRSVNQKGETASIDLVYLKSHSFIFLGGAVPQLVEQPSTKEG